MSRILYNIAVILLAELLCLGTGSGVGTYVLRLLRDEYPDVYRLEMRSDLQLYNCV